MFYFDELDGQKILRSNLLDKYEGRNAFFTTREVNIPLTQDFASRIITPQQTHSDHIETIDEREEYPDTDGLILTEPDTAIYLRFADCTPLIFYDTKHNIAAISHAGWRGTAARIGVKTVAKMVMNFSSRVYDLIVLIGPAISMCCYEVSDDVKNQLLSTVKNTKGLYKKQNVDLKQINARQLKEIGVHNIDICNYCTSCNNDLFYSHRKENGTDKRHFAVVKLNNIEQEESTQVQ